MLDYSTNMCMYLPIYYVCVLQDPHLLFTYRYIGVGKYYTFTGLKDSILNKGLSNEHRVKVTTPVSRITRELTLSQDTHLHVPSNLASYQVIATVIVIMILQPHHTPDTVCIMVGHLYIMVQFVLHGP